MSRTRFDQPAAQPVGLRASDLELLDEPDIFVPRPHALAVDTVSGHSVTEVAPYAAAPGLATWR